MPTGDLPPLVVDANVLIAAALRDGVCRRLLLDPRLQLYAPADLWTEVDAITEEIVRRSGVPESAWQALRETLRDRIVEVPRFLVAKRMREAETLLSGGDLSDAPYLATALALGGLVWTHDKALRRRALGSSLSTPELVARLE